MYDEGVGVEHIGIGKMLGNGYRQLEDSLGLRGAALVPPFLIDIFKSTFLSARIT